MFSATDLGPRLSKGAAIVFPGDPAFDTSTARWREWHAPRFAAVVKVATEHDVQETIRYANQKGVPFVARSGGHGATEALAEAVGAIQIDLRAMDKVEVSPGGTTATVGGGASIKKVVADLMAVGKQTVTGVCESVGVSGPILGGGHGWLQGQYGLAADQIISARLVLPDGNIVTVSDESNPDLFWALRGAGHNFGIVTEWECRLHDIKNPKWSYGIFVFPGDKLEALFELTNKMMKDQPPEATHWCYILKVPEIDPEHPILWYAIIYDGPVETARAYAKPIYDLGPTMVNAGAATVPEIAALTFMAEDSVGCAYGFTNHRQPIGLKSYNIAALRRVYDDIDDTTRRVPELAGSFIMLEGYSTQGVQAVDERSTAFPHRGDKIIVMPFVQYRPDPAIDEVAQAFCSRMRGHMLQGSDDPEHLRAYVNYAHGSERLEEVYGWDEWRLEKLKSLKKKWDPENRMRYYVPIA